MAEEAQMSRTDALSGDEVGSSGKLKIVLGLAGIVLVGVIGGAGYYFAFAETRGGDEVIDVSRHSKAENEPKSLMTKLDSLIVNLNEMDTTRYLKVELQLSYKGAEIQDELEARNAQIRDLCIGILSSKSYSDVEGATGKQRLKEELIFGINEILTSGQIDQIYFTNFVVQ